MTVVTCTNSKTEACFIYKLQVPQLREFAPTLTYTQTQPIKHNLERKERVEDGLVACGPKQKEKGKNSRVKLLKLAKRMLVIYLHQLLNVLSS